MKTLYFLRHAKSSWKDASIADFDRPLAPRGEKAAKKMTAFMAEDGILPDLIICSAARRARQTLEIIQTAWDWRVPTQVSRWPYDGGTEELLGQLDKTPPRIGALMIIAHLPTLQMAALELISGGDESAVTDLTTKFPTCALAEILFPARSWKSCTPGTGKLLRMLKPKALL